MEDKPMSRRPSMWSRVSLIGILGIVLSFAMLIAIHGASWASTTPTPNPTPTLESFPTPCIWVSKIYGYVVDTKGNPIKSVFLSVEEVNVESTKTSATDTEGFFEFYNLHNDSSYIIKAKKNGYKRVKVTVSLGEEGEEVEIVMKKKKRHISSTYRETKTIKTKQHTYKPSALQCIMDSDISGYVVDTEGNQIEQVLLNLKGTNTEVTKTSATDAEGFFEFFDLQSDTYTIKANKNGYMMTKVTVSTGNGQEEVEIVMNTAKK